MILLFLTAVLAQGVDERRILGEIEAFDTQIAAISTELEGMSSRSAAAEAARAVEVAAAQAAADRVFSRKERTRVLVRALYQIRRHGLLRLLFGADDAADLRRRARYLLDVIQRDEEEARQFAKLAGEREAKKSAAAAAAETAATLRAELESRKQALLAERDRRLSLLRNIRRQPQLAAQAVRERDFEQARLGESVAQREATAPVAADAATFRQRKGSLPLPVSGRLLRGFGPYIDPASGERTQNLGLDFSAPFGTAFRAVADGVVTRSGYVRGYGQVVMLQHGAYTTLYAHANGLRVAQGQEVRTGDVLGLVGNTGLTETDEYRLHFEIRYNGTPQDPAEWLGR